MYVCDRRNLFLFEVSVYSSLVCVFLGKGLVCVSSSQIIEVNLGDTILKIKALPREYQHTCKSTGLMLWESAQLIASVIAANPTIVAGKRVLELGCGCGGICSMVAVKSADLVVSTDGDIKALDLLTQNLATNLDPSSLDKLITRKLEWGNKEHIEAIKELNDRGFEIIIGTDVCYVGESISPLFATAKELILSSNECEEREPALILCHVLRRVDEPSILSTASQFSFQLVDKWPVGFPTGSSKSIISTWFSENAVDHIPTTALNIMYFERVK
ncbi:hypothetical protein U1Q18_017900 [Sarracenia purpurea var. burkii]